MNLEGFKQRCNNDFEKNPSTSQIKTVFSTIIIFFYIIIFFILNILSNIEDLGCGRISTKKPGRMRFFGPSRSPKRSGIM